MCRVCLPAQASSSGTELFATSPGRPVHGVTEALPFRIISHGYRHPGTVASAGIDIVRRHTSMMVAHGAMLPLVHLGLQQVFGQVGEHIFCLCKFDELSLACPITMMQSDEYGKSRPRSAGGIHMYDRRHSLTCGVVGIAA
jgi:hypothetical protein